MKKSNHISGCMHPYSRQLTMPSDSATIAYYRNPANILKGWAIEQ